MQVYTAQAKPMTVPYPEGAPVEASPPLAQNDKPIVKEIIP
jgi:hypothetical protein